MMIMHEPDKKKMRRKWLSEPLLHFSEPADWRGGGGKAGEKKKRSIFTVGLERAGCLLSQGLHTVQSSLCCRIRADIPSVRTSLWKRAVLLLPHVIAQTASFVTLAGRACKVLHLVIEVRY